MIYQCGQQGAVFLLRLINQYYIVHKQLCLMVLFVCRAAFSLTTRHVYQLATISLVYKMPFWACWIPKQCNAGKPAQKKN